MVNTVCRPMAAALMLAFILFCAAHGWAGVVYSALRGGTWCIYFQTDLTSTPKPVGETGTEDKSAPVLAPDGQRVAFEVQGIGIVVCALDAAARCQVIRQSRGTLVRPAWHPTTSELILVNFVVNGRHEDSEILTTRSGLVEAGPLLTQTGNQDYPDVSPDGRLLAYTSAHTVSLHRSAVQVVQQLWVMDLETGVARQLLLGNTQDIQPRWSSSGQELAFASDRSGQFEIWVVNTDGSGLRQVTSGLGAKTWPAWSPDGQSIMFTL